MWVTLLEKLLDPIVEYGIEPDKLDFIEKGVWNDYNVGHFGFHGRIYRATMKNLLPRTQYYYRVGDALIG